MKLEILRLDKGNGSYGQKKETVVEGKREREREREKEGATQILPSTAEGRRSCLTSAHLLASNTAASEGARDRPAAPENNTAAPPGPQCPRAPVRARERVPEQRAEPVTGHRVQCDDFSLRAGCRLTRRCRATRVTRSTSVLRL